MYKRIFIAFIIACGFLGILMISTAWADGIVVDLSSNEEDLRVIGEESLDYLGEMATGDINDDGFQDLIIGASGYNEYRGATYIVFGSDSLSGTIDLNGTSVDADIVIRGTIPGGLAGHFVTSGDFTGDGYADIAIAADRAAYAGRSQAGAVYVIPGPITATLTSLIYLTDTDWVTLTVYGEADGDRLGRSLAAVDVN